jgi:DNA topoisomerase I
MATAGAAMDARAARGGRRRGAPPPMPAPVVAVDPVQSAREAGLRYVSDEQPGIRRRKRGTGFGYVGPDGAPIRDGETLARIKALAIPPAWTEVWICPDPRGHIQATGLDAKGRKQYRYHARWHAVRDETKFARMLAFGRALPRIRERAEADLKRPGFPREKVLAAIVRLLEKTLIRVGNEEYARENKSYGLTTLRNRHARVEGGTVRFKFKGKSGKDHQITLRDRRLAGIVRRLQELPGQALFQYVDDEGVEQRIDSGDVNAYLRELTGEEFTAKDFRTWAGTVLCSVALREVERAESEAQAKRTVAEVVKTVAARLGNTPTVCRKSYIHPEVIEAYMDGSMGERLAEEVAAVAEEAPGDLDPDERSVMRLLQERLAEAS